MNYKKSSLISILVLFFSISLLSQIETIKKVVPDTQRVKNILNDARQYILKGNDSALYCSIIARDISLKINWTKGVANSYVEVGNFYNAKGNYELSLTNFTEGYRLHDSINYKRGMSNAANSIGNMYLGWGNSKKALSNYQNSYDIAYSYSDKFMMCISLFGMANVYDVNSQFSEAMARYTKAFYYIETAPQCKDFLSAYYINVSSILNKQNKSKLAVLNLHKALVILKPTNDMYAIGNAYEMMGNSYLNLNIEDSALYYFTKSEQILLKNGALDGIQELYLQVSKHYQKKKNFEKAFDYYVKHIKYKDSIFNTNKAIQILEIEKLNENRTIKEKITNISSELSQSREIVQQKKHENKIIYISLSVLVFFFTFIAVLLFKNYKTNLILKQKNKETNVLVQEIHHRVKNNLQFIAAMLKMQLNTIKDEGNQQILKETSRRINAMSLVHEMLYNKEKLEYVSLKEYVSELVAKLKEMVYDLEEPIVFKLDIDDMKFNINNCVAIGMITSEIISNAIKHAFLDIKDPVITINLKVDTINQLVIYTIFDNGTGSNNQGDKTGLGLRLIDIFSRQLESEYRIENNAGTYYQFKIPYNIHE